MCNFFFQEPYYFNLYNLLTYNLKKLKLLLGAVEILQKDDGPIVRLAYNEFRTNQSVPNIIY